MWENDLSGQTYLYRIIYRHSQILANTPNIMGTLRSAECPRNIERITSSKTFSLGVVYSKLLAEKSCIVKLVREIKKKIGSFTWAVLYLSETDKLVNSLFSTILSFFLSSDGSSGSSLVAVVDRQTNSHTPTHAQHTTITPDPHVRLSHQRRLFHI